jgi:hypothetical protein
MCREGTRLFPPVHELRDKSQPKEKLFMEPIDLNRRLILLTSMLSAIAPEMANASPIDPHETFVLPREQIEYHPWSTAPPHSGEMATLYGDINKPGLYLVMMKWNPGWFSAPHTYATDRIQVVVSGTWYVNSGPDFAPQEAVPVHAGGFVKRAARTPHYDGVPGHVKEPVVIAVFGMGPVDMQLSDPSKPGYRRA